MYHRPFRADADASLIQLGADHNPHSARWAIRGVGPQMTSNESFATRGFPALFLTEMSCLCWCAAQFSIECNYPRRSIALRDIKSSL